MDGLPDTGHHPEMVSCACITCAITRGPALQRGPHLA